MSLRESIVPGVTRRSDFALKAKKSALLIIDVQQYLSMPESEEEANSYLFHEALPSVVPNIEKLAKAFRVVRDDPEAADQHTGCEVIFSYLQALTVDGRDISTDYKLSGPKLAHIPRTTTSPDDLFLSSCRPSEFTGKGDILLPKTSCSVFQSTNIDYVLRNLGVEQIVICGQLTDQCVESAVRDAADLGYLVTVPEDACAAASAKNHVSGLESMQGFCRMINSAQVMDEILEDMLDTNVPVRPQQAQLSDEVVVEYFLNKGVDEARELAEQLVGLIMQSEKNQNGGETKHESKKTKKKKSKKEKKAKASETMGKPAAANQSTEVKPNAEPKPAEEELRELSYLERMMKAHLEDSSEESEVSEALEGPDIIEEAPPVPPADSSPVEAATEPTTTPNAEHPVETPDEAKERSQPTQHLSTDERVVEYLRAKKLDGPANQLTKMFEENNRKPPTRSKTFGGGDSKGKSSRRQLRRGVSEDGGKLLAEMAAFADSSSQETPVNITDDFVLEYLRDKGFDGAANYLKTCLNRRIV